MIKVELPAMPAGTWLAVILETHNIAGTPMHSVTIRSRGGKPPERRWFADVDHAFEWGLGQADARALPFFDQSAGESE